MNPPRFDPSTIRTLANDNSYYRGEQYLKSGAVHKLILDGDTYRAHVYGTRRYVVEIQGDEDKLECTCTCPYDWGGICKHIVAVMLLVLQNEENGREIESLSPAESDIPLDDLFASLSTEELCTFVRLQATEFPQLAENLQIFSAGATETAKTVEDYQAEINSAFENATFIDPYEYEHYRYDAYEDFDEEDRGGTVESVLETFVDMARKYQAQGNWIEDAKIQETIVHACLRKVTEGRDTEDDDYEEEYDEEDFYDGDYATYDDTGYIENACYSAAHKALIRWAKALTEAQPAKDKRRMLDRLTALFADDLYGFSLEVWEEAYSLAVLNAGEAKHVLSTLKKRVKRLDQKKEKAGVLLHLLGLSGDTERFIKVGRNAVRSFPHLALPLGEKLVATGKKREAIEMVTGILDQIDGTPYSYDYYETEEVLRRFLLRNGDRRRDYKRMVECGKALLFSGNKLDDYLMLRELLKTRKEREALVAEIKEECTAAALLDIFSAEERWDDLLDAAHTHCDDRDFPRMIERLQDRFPAACFDLSRQALLEWAESAGDRRSYQQVAIRAHHLQKIPGHQEKFAQLMGELVERYSRRISMIDELGELAELGKQWRERIRRERYEQVMAGQVEDVGIDELMEICPIGDDDREKLPDRRITWNRASAALVWAILTAHGGRMAAADISAAIAEHRHCKPQSAGAHRSAGISTLEALGYIEVDRQRNRLGEVRLIGQKRKKSRTRRSK